MRDALVEDLTAIGGHQIMATVDPRFPLRGVRDVEVITLGHSGMTLFDLIPSADAVWPIAPETGRCLEHMTELVAATGTRVLGSTPIGIREACDKAALPDRLREIGVAHPTTRVVRQKDEWRSIVKSIAYPVVVKPQYGAGCEGVFVANTPIELEYAIEDIFGLDRAALVLVQEFVSGTAASVSMLVGGQGAIPLALNEQSIHRTDPCSQTGTIGPQKLRYDGGATPFERPLTNRAFDAAVRTCNSIKGLRGFVGVDVVLGPSDVFVIEINARLTTAYLGIREAFDCNIAALAIDACEGNLASIPRTSRRVRFTASGQLSDVRKSDEDQCHALHDA